MNIQEGLQEALCCFGSSAVSLNQGEMWDRFSWISFYKGWGVPDVSLPEPETWLQLVRCHPFSPLDSLQSYPSRPSSYLHDNKNDSLNRATAVIWNKNYTVSVKQICLGLFIRKDAHATVICHSLWVFCSDIVYKCYEH